MVIVYQDLGATDFHHLDLVSHLQIFVTFSMLSKNNRQRFLFGVSNQFQAIAVPQGYLELAVGYFSDVLELLVVVLSADLAGCDVNVFVVGKDQHLFL